MTSPSSGAGPANPRQDKGSRPWSGSRVFRAREPPSALRRDTGLPLQQPECCGSLYLHGAAVTKAACIDNVDAGMQGTADTSLSAAACWQSTTTTRLAQLGPTGLLRWCCDLVRLDGERSSTVFHDAHRPRPSFWPRAASCPIRSERPGPIRPRLRLVCVDTHSSQANRLQHSGHPPWRAPLAWQVARVRCSRQPFGAAPPGQSPPRRAGSNVRAMYQYKPTRQRRARAPAPAE